MCFRDFLIIGDVYTFCDSIAKFKGREILFQNLYRPAAVPCQTFLISQVSQLRHPLARV